MKRFGAGIIPYSILLLVLSFSLPFSKFPFSVNNEEVASAFSCLINRAYSEARSSCQAESSAAERSVKIILITIMSRWKIRVGAHLFINYFFHLSFFFLILVARKDLPRRIRTIIMHFGINWPIIEWLIRRTSRFKKYYNFSEWPIREPSACAYHVG